MDDALKPKENKTSSPDEKVEEDKIEDRVEESEDKEKPVGDKKDIKKESKEIIEKDDDELVKESAKIDEMIEKTPKPVDTIAKDEKQKKKIDRDSDFRYIVRISNTDINGEKNVVYGLTSIKGIGVHMATLIADETGIDRYKKIGNLKEAQIEKLQETIDKISNNAPGWMLNHRKDYDKGEDIHLIGSDIDMRLRDEINIMKKIRSYRGIRHERGLTVRGQRTRANNRKGLALGVSKKRE